MTLENSTVCIVGLGYVGLPLAEAFAQKLKVIGFDLDKQKVFALQKSPDDQRPTTNDRRPTTDDRNGNLVFTTNPEKIKPADFFILCVPTPVTRAKFPDLSYVEYAARLVGANMRRNSTVILESTVYPGVTEEIVKPILEQESGYTCGQDFRLAYSPERVNPGDEEHTLQTITKIVAGLDEETTQLVADLYRLVTGSVYCAPDIRTAEAAKVIENIQRDLNIALVNELSIIFLENKFDIKKINNLDEAPRLDAIILAVAHRAFREISLDQLKSITTNNPVLIDVRRFFKKENAEAKGFYYQTL